MPPAAPPRPGRRRFGLRRYRLGVPVVLYAHPFELGVGAAFVILGLRGIIAGTSGPSVDALPEVPLLMYRVASMLAGAGIVVGLMLREHPVGRAIERAACYVLASALLAFALLVVGHNGGIAIPSALVSAFIGVACFFRARAIRKTELVICETLTEVDRVGDVARRIVDGRDPLPTEDGRHE